MENNYTSQFAIGLRNLSKRSEFQLPQNVVRLIEKGLQLGITTYDNADVYGDFNCETIFGNALKVQPALRQEIQIISKCGIQIVTTKRPANQIKFYELNYDYLLSSVNQSLKNFNTDYIDLFLLHRPDYLMDIDSIAKAITELRDSGKVLNFGVSNLLFTKLINFVPDLTFRLL